MSNMSVALAVHVKHVQFHLQYRHVLCVELSFQISRYARNLHTWQEVSHRLSLNPLMILLLCIDED